MTGKEKPIASDAGEPSFDEGIVDDDAREGLDAENEPLGNTPDRKPDPNSGV